MGLYLTKWANEGFYDGLPHLSRLPVKVKKRIALADRPELFVLMIFSLVNSFRACLVIRLTTLPRDGGWKQPVRCDEQLLLR